MFTGQQNIDRDRVAAYIRWSTEEQGEGTTLEVQRDSCKHFMLSQGWNFRDDLVFVDDGWSGATLDRPAMGRLREAVQRGDVQCVVVYKLDRLSRNLLDCVSLVTREWKDRAPLFSTKENFTTDSPLGELIFNILVSFAQFERNTIRDRTMSGKVKRAEQGKWLGSRPPFGYNVVRTEVTPGTNISELQPNPDTAPLVKQMFEWSAQGTSSASIASRLNGMGVPSPSGGLWTIQTVLVILRNQIYRGRVVYGKANSKRKFLREEIEADGRHEPLVEETLWNQVQAACESRSAMHPRTVASDYVFSGLLICDQCKTPMTGDKWGWKTKDGEKRHVKIYRCRTHTATGTCTSAKIKERDVEEAFLSEIEALTLPGKTREYLEQRNRAADTRRQAAEVSRQAARDRLKQVENTLRNIDVAYLEHGTLAPSEYKVKKEQYQAERTSLQSVLAEPIPENSVVDLEALAVMVGQVRQRWPWMTEAERKTVALELVRNYGLTIKVGERCTVSLPAEDM